MTEVRDAQTQTRPALAKFRTDMVGSLLRPEIVNPGYLLRLRFHRYRPSCRHRALLDGLHCYKVASSYLNLR
jgi:hypothetical protein